MKRFPFSYFASTAFPALMAGLVIVIALILLSLCYKEPERPRFTSYDADLSKATAVLSNQLMQAYKARSRTQAAQFFERWHRAYRPNADDAKALNDTVKAVYDLFHDYFTPLLRTPSGSDTTYRYAIIQSNIRFYVMGDSSFLNKIENCQYPDWIEITHASADKPYSTISNFRPELKDPDLKTLYPNQAYRAALLSFLGWGMDKEGYFTPVISPGERSKRREFLLPIVPLEYGTDYINLNTPPGLRLIVFNRSLDRAFIVTDHWHQGGELSLHKHGGSWKIMKEHPYTWTE